MQHAMWTIGPSFPRLRPADTESMMPTDLMIRVHLPRYPLMMNPLRIVLICDKGRQVMYIIPRRKHLYNSKIGLLHRYICIKLLNCHIVNMRVMTCNLFITK